MDRLDLQIIRRMGVAPFLVWPHLPASLRPSALAAAMKVSTDTVKRRLAALEARRVFQGTQVFPNPRLFGLQVGSFHFATDRERRARVAPEAVARVPGVLAVYDMVGGDRCIDLAFRDAAQLDGIRRGLAAMLGEESHHFLDYPMPQPSVAMSRLDWRILQALRGAPSTSLATAAAALGVSLRTVKRRFNRMARAGALDVVGLFDVGALEGHFLVELLFHLKPSAGPQDVPKVLNAFRSRWVAQWSPPDRSLGAVALVTVARSAREVEDLRREAETLQVVERCDALVLEGASQDWSWLDAQIAQRAARSTPDAPVSDAARTRPARVVQNAAPRAR